MIIDVFRRFWCNCFTFWVQSWVRSRQEVTVDQTVRDAPWCDAAGITPGLPRPFHARHPSDALGWHTSWLLAVGLTTQAEFLSGTWNQLCSTRGYQNLLYFPLSILPPPGKIWYLKKMNEFFFHVYPHDEFSGVKMKVSCGSQDVSRIRDQLKFFPPFSGCLYSYAVGEGGWSHLRLE